LQSWLAKDLFGNVGGKPSIKHVVEISQNINEEAPKEQEEAEEDEKLNPFTMLDKILIVLSSLGGLIYLFNYHLEKIEGYSLVPFTVGSLSGSNFVVLCALALLLILLVTRISRYLSIVSDRIIAVSIFGVFTVFFF